MNHMIWPPKSPDLKSIKTWSHVYSKPLKEIHYNLMCFRYLYSVFHKMMHKLCVLSLSLSFCPSLFFTGHLSICDWRWLWLFLHVSKYSCEVEWLITQSAAPMPLSTCVIWQRWHKVFLGWVSGWGTDAQWSMSTSVIILMPWWPVTTAVTQLHTLPAGWCDPITVQTVTARTWSRVFPFIL